MQKLAMIALAFMVFFEPAFAGPETDSPDTTQAQADDAQCTSYGAKVGSTAYVDCRLKLVEMRDRKEKVPASPPHSIRCHTIFLGSIARTRCK